MSVCKAEVPCLAPYAMAMRIIETQLARAARYLALAIGLANAGLIGLHNIAPTSGKHGQGRVADDLRETEYSAWLCCQPMSFLDADELDTKFPGLNFQRVC